MAKAASNSTVGWRLSLSQLIDNPFGGGKVLQAISSRTLADWGFMDAQLRRQSLAVDALELTRPMASFDAIDEIDFGQLVTLLDPTGRTRFVGRRVLVPGHASGSEEAKTYFFAGPWYWFERLIYHQSWQQLLINGILVPRQTSHLLLNINGLSVGDQIRAIAQYAIDQGAPFQLGITDIPIVPFVTEITDQSCSQIIIDQLRWAPDSVAWFDYSTNPPTFHCRQKANLAPLTVRLGASQSPTIADSGLTIAARPDLQISAVALRYERTDTKDGTEYLSLGEDVYPPGATGKELNALSQTITLVGFNVTTLSASVLCETIDTTSLEWWKRVIPELQDQRISNLALIAGTVERVLQGSRTPAHVAGTASSQFPRMLVEGQLADWMRDATNNELDWEQEELTAQFSFDLAVDTSPGASVLEKNQKGRFTVHLVSTNAPAGVSSYTTTESEEQGEAQPIGLAQYLYNALSPLEYEGAVNTTEQECTGYIGPGSALNLAATAIAAHAAMAARVQSVEENIDSGQTRISFGPTIKLSLSSILELLKASRHRRRWTRTQVQTDGELTRSATAQLGEATANNNTIPGDRQRTLFACQDTPKRVELDASIPGLNITGANAGQSIQAQLVDPIESFIKFIGASGTVDARTADCLVAGIARTLRIRQVRSCDPTDPVGSNWVRLVLCSDRIRIS